MPEISATEAARNFAAILDRVEESSEEFVVIRRGIPVARIVPVPTGRGADIKAALLANPPSPGLADAIADALSHLEN